ncbi:486_t:CDS:2, partial [Acaulospora colombiana]
MHRGSSQYPSPRVTRTTSFGSNASTSSGRSTGVYNECIKKTTSFDDEDSTTDSSSEMAEEDDESSCGVIDATLAQEVSILRKEIDSVKSSLAGLQKDRVEMLNEKKQLEEQYHEAKAEVKKTLETSTNELLSYNRLLNEKMEKLSLELSNVSPLESEDGSEWPDAYATIMSNCVNQAKELELLQSQIEKSKEDFRLLLSVKDEIERTLEAKEHEYLEKIRQCEAVTSGQAGMIDSMESLLKDLEGKMDKLINEKIQQQQAAAIGKKKTHRKQKSSISSTASSLRRQSSSGGVEQLKKPPPSMSGTSTPSRHRHQSSISSISQISHAPIVAEREHIRPVSPAPSKDSSTSNLPTSDLIPPYCISPPQVRQKVENPITFLTDEARIQHQSRFSLAKRWIEDDEVSGCQHES